jgi:hypothetical protein
VGNYGETDVLNGVILNELYENVSNSWDGVVVLNWDDEASGEAPKKPEVYWRN